MKTFKQFQEQIKTGGTIKKPTVIMPDGKELPGLGGGGGGTDSITDKSPAKSLKKRAGDVAKVLTFPFHKRKKDPTEKFATEGVASLAEKLSDKEYKEVDALLNRDTLLRGNLIKNFPQRGKFETMKARDTFRRIKKNKDGKLRIDRGTEKKIKVNRETVSKNFPELSKKPAKKYPKYYTLPPIRSIDDRLKEKEAIKKKYATEGVAALAVGGSKLIPALMTGIGAAGTYLQTRRGRPEGGEAKRYKKKNPNKKRKISRQQQKIIDLENRRGEKLNNPANKVQNKIRTTEPKDRVNIDSPRTKSDDVLINPSPGEAKKEFNLLTKYLKKQRSVQGNTYLKKKGIEEEMATPTNSTGPAVPGTGDDSSTVVVKKKKKTYAYGGRGSRKMWMNNK